MESLRDLSSEIGRYKVAVLPRRKVAIPTWRIRFPGWTRAGLHKSSLGTYRIKPLVEVSGEPLFGELAILRWLQKDGWDGVRVDTFHGEKLFWKGLPDRTTPCLLPAKAEKLFDRIVSINGTQAGFFDVFAWRGHEFLFVEYKGEGDSVKQRQCSWVRSAIKAGVTSSSLLFVIH